MFPKYLGDITYSNFLRGGVTKKKGKFGKNSQLGLPPPPSSDNSEYFEFQKLLKNSDPLPPRTEFRNV